MKMEDLKFDEKGLIPAVVQNSTTGVVLMQAWMNKEALAKTIETGKVTFFSRSRQRLWTKGEESGNFLILETILSDCDNDCLLVKAQPTGPVCHTGSDTCWNEDDRSSDFLLYLEDYLQKRKNESPEQSYTARLFAKGINKIAQKVGEEAVELIIESKDNDKELFLNEAADLMYHYIVLLIAKGYGLNDVIGILRERRR